MTTAFDALSYAKKLTAAGEKKEIAEAHAMAVKDLVLEEVATKTDLEALENRLIIKMGGMLAAAVGLLAILMKVL